MSDSASMSSESDESDDGWCDMVEVLFGIKQEVAEYPARVQKYVKTSPEQLDKAMIASCYMGASESLRLLLAAGANPNARLNGDEDGTSEDQQLGHGECPYFGVEKRMWRALQWAAMNHAQALISRGERRATIDVLLAAGADLYAEYIQPVWSPRPYPYPDELAYAYNPQDDYSKMMESDEGQYSPAAQLGYGLRCVIHAMFEDGAYVEGLLDSTLTLELEYRDSLGRTLIQAACRSSIGADSTISEMHFGTRQYADPEEKARNSAKISIFHTLQEKGADLLAVDSSGKNLLHHLFEARSLRFPTDTPPPIHNTIRWLTQNTATLLNRADNQGTCPLHSALQRMLCFRGEKNHILGTSHVMQVVVDLCDAGADPTVRDSRGNTALYYLAAKGVAGLDGLYQRFCVSGIDVNARNNMEKTAWKYS